MITFKSENNDYILEFDKSTVSRNFSFSSNTNEDRYLVRITIKDILGTVIKSIPFSDSEIYILLDNINNILHFGLSDMKVSLSSKEVIDSTYIISIYSETINPNQYTNPKYLKTNFTKWNFKIEEYSFERIVPVISFEITDSILQLSEAIYNSLVLGLSEDEIISLGESLYFTLKNVN